MASKRIRVTYTDGRTKEARISPKVEVAFERHFNMSVSKAGADISAEHLYYLAWSALYHSGQEPLDFDSFLDVLDEVDNVEAAKVDPTQLEAPPEQSST